MAVNAEDADDEYLDDPISLIAIDIKQEKRDEDVIEIASSSDEEESYTSSYGKKNFVLPITFFDISRNLRLLNKCKPMTIKIIDCKEYPTYYRDCTEKSRAISDNIVQEELKYENKPKTDINSMQIAINDSIIHKDDEEHEGDEVNTNNLNSIAIHNSTIVSTVDNNQESEKPNTHLQNNVTFDSIAEYKVDEIQDRLSPNTDNVKSVAINDSIHKVDKPVTDVGNIVTSDDITLHKFDTKYERDKTHTEMPCIVMNESIAVHKFHNDEKGNRPNIDVQNIVTNDTVTIQKLKKKPEGEKKCRASRGHSYYEKQNKRKENRKRIALSCKDLTQVDFKRNTGLVGLKITDTIFKQIVNSEKVLTKTKKNLAENTFKENDRNQNEMEKTTITTQCKPPQEKCKEKCRKAVEKTYDKSKNARNKSNKTKTQRPLSVTKNADDAETMYKEKGNDFNDKSKNKIRCVENQHEKNNENECEMTLIRTIITSEKANEKSESDIYMNAVAVEKQAENTFVKSSISSGIDKPYEKSDSYLKEVEVEKEAEKRLTKTIVSSREDKSNENSKSNNYMKEVGVALDNLGTTIIPIADTRTNNHAPKNATDNTDNKSINTDKKSATVVDKSRTNNDIEIRCSIRIPSKKIVEKVLKLKQITYDSKQPSDKLQNIPDQRSPKESMAKGDQTVPNLNVKCSPPNYKSSCVGSEKDKLKGEKKQALKSVDKDASKKYQPGSNSPVIACTTITQRPGPPKPLKKISLPKNTKTVSQKPDNSTAYMAPNSQKNLLPSIQLVKPLNTSSDVQKTSALPKVATINQADVSNNSKKIDPPQHNSLTISYPNITVVSKPKGTTINNQNSPAHIKATKNIEDTFPNIYPLVKHLFDIKNQRVPTEHQVPDHMSKTNQINKSNQETPIQSKSVTGNINNQSTNGVIQNQTHLNPQMHPSNNSKFSGNNAIICRRPPPPPSRNIQNNELPNQRHPIQTLINHRPQYQVPPMRFRLPPPPPPNYLPNLAHVRPDQRLIPPGRMLSTCWRGPGMTSHRLRFPGPCLPSYRPPLPMQQMTQSIRHRPRPPQAPPTQEHFRTNSGPLSPQVNKDSFNGTTSDGDPIKRIHILPQTNTVDDKQMMLAELNSAMMSPELISNKPEDELSNDLKPVEPVNPKYSKPCPLSKKLNVATDINKMICDKPPLNIGYSPPILPIWTYEESFQWLGQNDLNMKKRVSTDDAQNRIPSKVKRTARIMKQDKKQKTPHSETGKQDIAKKITFEDYRKRVSEGDVTDAAKVRKLNEVKNVTDDYNQDLGYDSDTTVKL